MLLKLQRLQHGSTCVDEYYKLMKSMLLKLELQFEREEEIVARFVSGLKREIQDVVTNTKNPFNVRHFQPLTSTQTPTSYRVTSK